MILRRPEGGGRDGGFTLLELLIAMALLSVVLAAVYSTFALAHRAMEGVDSSLVRLQEARTALDLIGREAEALSWVPGDRNSAFSLEDRDIYGKQTSRLSFTAFSPQTIGLSLLSYYVEENNGSLILFKKIRRPDVQEKDQAGVELIEGITSFSVEALQDNRWLKTWDAKEMTKVPAEIRITLSLPLKDRPLVLHQTVRPKIGRSI